MTQPCVCRSRYVRVYKHSVYMLHTPSYVNQNMSQYMNTVYICYTTVPMKIQACYSICTQSIYVIHPSIHPSIYPSIYSSIYASIYPFNHPSIHPSIYSCICLSIYLWIRPSLHSSLYSGSQPTNQLEIHPSFYQLIHPPFHQSSHLTIISPVYLFILVFCLIRISFFMPNTVIMVFIVKKAWVMNPNCSVNL